MTANEPNVLLAQMIERVEELESRLTFQEDTLQQLNEVITRQDQTIDHLERKVITLSDKLNEMAYSSSGQSDQLINEVPPHY